MYYYYEEVEVDKDLVTDTARRFSEVKIKKFVRSDYYLLERADPFCVTVPLIDENIIISSNYNQKRRDSGESYTDEFRSISTVTSRDPKITLFGKPNKETYLPFNNDNFIKLDSSETGKAGIHDEKLFGDQFEKDSIFDLSDDMFEIIISEGPTSLTKLYFDPYNQSPTIFMTMDLLSLEKLIHDIESKKYRSIRCCIFLPVCQPALPPFKYDIDPKEDQPMYFVPDLKDIQHLQSGSIQLRGRIEDSDPVDETPLIRRAIKELSEIRTYVSSSLQTIKALLGILLVIELVRLLI